MTILNLHFYQLAIILISAVMIYFGVEKYFRHKASQSFLKLAARLIVWGGMIYIAFYPNVSYQLAEFMGIEDNINAVILLGFLLVFLFIFKILSVVERIEQDISILTRKDALKDLNKREPDENPHL